MSFTVKGLQSALVTVTIIVVIKGTQVLAQNETTLSYFTTEITEPKPATSTRYMQSTVEMINTTLSNQSYISTDNNVSLASSDFQGSVSENSTVPYNESSDPTRKRGGFVFDTSIIYSGSVSEEQYTKIKSVTKYFELIIAVFGIIFNCFNILIFSCPFMKCSSTIILLCLSSSELTVVTSDAVNSVVAATYGRQSIHSETYLYVVKYMTIYAATVFSRTTFCFILFIASERLLAVLFPLRAKYFKLIQRPLVTFVVVLFFIALCHVHITFKFDVVKYWTINDEPRYGFKESKFFTENTALFRGLLTAADIAFVYIPLFGCLILNTILAVALNHHNRAMRQMNSSNGYRQMNRVDKQITITVLVSAFIFTILALPTQLTELVQTFATDYGMYKKNHFLFLSVLEIQSLCHQMAYMTSFICYFALGGNFRKTFYARVLRCRTTPQRTSKSS